MNILLDTNAFIWFAENDSKLSRKAKEIIEDERNIILISVATFWEIAIKKSIDKLEMKKSMDELYKLCLENGFEVLSILFEHTKDIETLPYHHKDPFDRLIISQAISEGMVIVSSDDIFDKYDVNRIW